MKKFLFAAFIIILFFVGAMWSYHSFWAEYHNLEKPTTMEAFSNQFGIIGIFVSLFAFTALVITIIQQQDQIKFNKTIADRDFLALDEENFRNQIYRRLENCNELSKKCFYISIDDKKSCNPIYDVVLLISKIIESLNGKHDFTIGPSPIRVIQSIKQYIDSFTPWTSNIYRVIDDILKKYDTKQSPQGKYNQATADLRNEHLNIVFDSLQKNRKVITNMAFLSS